MANTDKVGTDLSLEDVLDGWSNKARHCFESLKESVRIDGSEWSGIVSVFGRTPVPILNIGDKNICQVHPDGDRVVIRLIRSDDMLQAVKKDRKLPAKVKRAFAAPGKLRYLAEVPVSGMVDARAASSILRIKAASIGEGARPIKAYKRTGTKRAARRKSI